MPRDLPDPDFDRGTSLWRRAYAAERHGAAARRLHARPFRRSAGAKLLVLYEPKRISLAQIYPLAILQGAIADRYGAQIRLAPNTVLETGLPNGLRDAETVILQHRLGNGADLLQRRLDILAADLPDATLHYFDSTANVDYRFAPMLDGRIGRFARKSLPRDPAVLTRPLLGDTQLTDYYNRLYGLEAPEVRYDLPDGFADRMTAVPSFQVAPLFLHEIARGALAVAEAARDIDVHARLEATKGSPWYVAMRSDAIRKLTAIPDLVAPVEAGVAWNAYLAELRRSKLTFSPFGYGELCWRDVEAIMCGSVLVKPDMSHLATAPEMYVPDRTYVPVAWDFSDLEETVQGLLADPDRRRRLAESALRTLQEQVRPGRLLDAYAFLFDD
jgi:hypothetical protein